MKKLFLLPIGLCFCLFTLASFTMLEKTSIDIKSELYHYTIQDAEIPRTINWIDQNKHIIGHTSHRPEDYRSTIKPGVDPQSLLDDYHAGRIEKFRIVTTSKIKVNFGKTIGTHIDARTHQETSTSWAMMHYGQKGAHFVPHLPDQY